MELEDLRLDALALGCTEEDLEGLSQEELNQLVEHLSSIPKVEKYEKSPKLPEGMEEYTFTAPLTEAEVEARGKRMLAEAANRVLEKGMVIPLTEFECTYRAGKHRARGLLETDTVEQKAANGKETFRTFKYKECLEATKQWMRKHTITVDPEQWMLVEVPVFWDEPGSLMDIKDKLASPFTVGLRLGSSNKFYVPKDKSNAEFYWRTARGLQAEAVMLAEFLMWGLNVEWQETHINELEKSWERDWSKATTEFIVTYERNGELVKEGWDIKLHAGDVYFETVHDLEELEGLRVDKVHAFNRKQEWCKENGIDFMGYIHLCKSTGAAVVNLVDVDAWVEEKDKKAAREDGDGAHQVQYSAPHTEFMSLYKMLHNFYDPEVEAERAAQEELERMEAMMW